MSDAQCSDNNSNLGDIADNAMEGNNTDQLRLTPQTGTLTPSKRSTSSTPVHWSKQQTVEEHQLQKAKMMVVLQDLEGAPIKEKCVFFIESMTSIP